MTILKLTFIHLLISYYYYLPLSYISNINYLNLIIEYYGISLIAYLVHRSSHQWKFPHFWYKAHVIGHHYLKYKPSRFLTDTYLLKSDNLLLEADTYVYPIPIMTFIFVYWRYCLDITVSVFILKTILVLLHFYLEIYIHEHVHLKNTWLDKYQLFLEIREKHYIHHTNQNKNYLFTNFLIDYIFGTYKK